MADTLATFNAYNYRTFALAPTTVKSEVFTPDSDKVYLVKSVVVSNYSGGAETVTLHFYSGSDTTEYNIANAVSLASGESLSVLPTGGVVIRGDLGDELRITASTDTTLHAAAVTMIMGRESGI